MQLSSNYNLKLMEGNDLIKRQDFVDNFTTIDTALGNKVDKKTHKIIFMPISRDTTKAAGDCSVIITRNGKVIFIDTGAKESYALIKKQLIKNNVSKIDYIIISHYHVDHCENLEELQKDFNLSNTVFYLCKHTDKFTYAENNVISLAGNNRILYPNTNDTLIVEDITLTFFNCDSEDIEYYDANSNNYNDYSMCCYCDCGNTTILFTGDISTLAQARINELGLFRKVDVLKVEHHAYDSSVNNDYIQQVNPKYSVVSECELAFSNNQNVNSESLNLMRNMGAEIFCTGINTIEFNFNDIYYTINDDYKLSSAKKDNYTIIYVDKTYNGISDGTAHKPFRTLQQAIGKIDDLGNLNVKIAVVGEYKSDEDIKIVNLNTVLIENVEINSLYSRNSNITMNNVTIKGSINRALYVVSSFVEGNNVVVNGDVTSSSDDFEGRGVCAYKSIVYFNNLEVSNKAIAVGSYNSSNINITNLKGSNNKNAIVCGSGSTLSVENNSMGYTNSIKYKDKTSSVRGAINFILLNNGDDLNECTSEGIYVAKTGAITLSLANKPEKIGYSLQLNVEKIATDGLIQKITSRHLNHVGESTNATGIFVRTYNKTDGWSSWYEIPLNIVS